MQGVQGLSIASSAANAFSGMFSGMSDAASLRTAANVDDENARLDLLQGAIQSEDIRRRGRAVQGEAIASEAASGGDVSGLSARDLIYQNSLDIELAGMNARYSAAQAARADQFSAQQKRTAARNAVIGGVMRAGAAAITGAQGQLDYNQRYNALFPGGSRLPMPPVYGPMPVSIANPQPLDRAPSSFGG